MKTRKMFKWAMDAYSWEKETNVGIVISKGFREAERSTAFLKLKLPQPWIECFT